MTQPTLTPDVCRESALRLAFPLVLLLRTAGLKPCASHLFFACRSLLAGDADAVEGVLDAVLDAKESLYLLAGPRRELHRSILFDWCLSMRLLLSSAASPVERASGFEAAREEALAFDLTDLWS